jgi:hypothetical protein
MYRQAGHPAPIGTFIGDVTPRSSATSRRWESDQPLLAFL